MGFFKSAKNFIGKFKPGKRKKSGKNETITRPLDPMQKFLTVGQYKVTAADETPNGQTYDLLVYQDEDGLLHQDLRPLGTDQIAWTRKYDPQLSRFRAFFNKKTGRRFVVEQQLDQFIAYVQDHTRQGKNSINLGIITDTHFKDKNSLAYYGYNGLTHLREFNYLENSGLLNLKAHLGDWIDGSDPGQISDQELITMEKAFWSERTNFAIIKGNNDANDNYDEHHDFKPSFPANEFETIMWRRMYLQPTIDYISRSHGLACFDYDDLRVITLNTSDVPYTVKPDGTKKYDARYTLAVREDQVQELIEILEQSSGKQVVFLSHGSPIDNKGENGLRYNGRSLHELFVAFNQREKGALNSRNVPPEFTLANSFDFTKLDDSARIVACFCGHKHLEEQYRINGIWYISFNASALMGPKQEWTNDYNRHWNRQLDLPTEAAGYIVNLDLDRHQMQIFGYGAATIRQVYRI